jgi:hypothetical protein
MNRLTLKRGLSFTRCVLLVLCFRLAAILTWQRVLLLKAVAKDCERQRVTLVLQRDSWLPFLTTELSHTGYI